MGYIARNTITNEVFYSKGANKLGRKVGCTGSNLTKFFGKEDNKDKDKVFKHWIISKTKEVQANDRGLDIKVLIQRLKEE